jgi:hypothetical protein
MNTQQGIEVDEADDAEVIVSQRESESMAIHDHENVDSDNFTYLV